MASIVFAEKLAPPFTLASIKAVGVVDRDPAATQDISVLEGSCAQLTPLNWPPSAETSVVEIAQDEELIVPCMDNGLLPVDPTATQDELTQLTPFK